MMKFKIDQENGWSHVKFDNGAEFEFPTERAQDIARWVRQSLHTPGYFTDEFGTFTLAKTKADTGNTFSVQDGPSGITVPMVDANQVATAFEDVARSLA